MSWVAAAPPARVATRNRKSVVKWGPSAGLLLGKGPRPPRVPCSSPGQRECSGIRGRTVPTPRSLCFDDGPVNAVDGQGPSAGVDRTALRWF